MRFLILAVFCGFVSTVQAKPYLDIQEIETPQHVKFWFVQDKNIPVVTLKFSAQGGAQLDPPGKEGTAELLSTVFDEGAGKRDSEMFQNDMDEYGISIKFSATRDALSGYLKTTVQYRDIAQQLFGDALNAPHFNDAAVQRMQAALQSALRFQMADPEYLANRRLFETIFAGQSYARPVEGTPESLAAITPDDLRREKDNLFCRQRLKIALVGDLEKEDAIKLADHFFGSWPACKTPVDAEFFPLQAKGKTVRVAWDGAQSTLLMAQAGLARKDQDWWAARILDFALGAGDFSSRLMEEIRVKRGFTYGIETAISAYDRAPLWLVQANIDAPKTDEAAAAIKKIWQDVAQNGLTESEIQEAKDYLIGSLPLALTSTDNIATILLQLQEDGLPKTTLDTRAAEISAVTAEDIKRVATARLKPEELTTIIVGPDIKDKNK